VKIVASCVLALALLDTFVPAASAQTSCSGWNATCRERCGKASCPRCVEQLRNCKKTGCWTEAAQYGGGKHCGLNKS
jgi:hypothetical protein